MNESNSNIDDYSMKKTLAIMMLTILAAGCASTGKNDTSKDSVARHAQLRDNHVVTTELKKQLKQWKGTPYKLGGNSLNGIDCSAFVQRTFNDKFDIALPRTTTAQTSQGIRIAKENLKPGDLVFFKTNWGGSGLHVGIYNGNNQFIHASSSKGVMTSSLEERYWKQRFYQARRLQTPAVT